jgi:hypothetical protein
MKWVKIKSWHAVKDEVGIFGAHTFCGRYADGPQAEDLPSEKSCETCLRLVARQQDT